MVWDLNNAESEVIDTLQIQQNMLSAYECAVCVNNYWILYRYGNMNGATVETRG